MSMDMTKKYLKIGLVVLLVIVISFSIIHKFSSDEDDDFNERSYDLNGNVILHTPKNPYALDVNQEVINDLKPSDFFEEVQGVMQKGFTNEFIFKLKNPINEKINFDNHIETSLYNPDSKNLDVTYEVYEYINKSGLVRKYNWIDGKVTGSYDDYVVDEGWKWIKTENPFDELNYNDEKLIKVIGKFIPETGLQNIDYLINAQVGDSVFEPENWVWFNTSFAKRKSLTITENSYRNSNNTAVLVNVTYEASMQTDFRDIAFANDTGEFSYYVSDNYTSDNAMFWVLIPRFDSGASTSDINMYYDSDTANSESNWKDVFVFNFNDNSIDTSLWTSWTIKEGGGSNASVSEANNRLEMYVNDGGNGESEALINTTLLTNMKDYEMINFTTIRDESFCASGNCNAQDSTTRIRIINTTNGNNICTLNLAQHVAGSSVYNHYNYTNWSLVMNYTGDAINNQVVLYRNNNSFQELHAISCNGIGKYPNFALEFSTFANAGTGGGVDKAYMYISNLGVRKWNTTEPTSSFGSEGGLSDYANIIFSNVILNSTNTNQKNYTNEDLSFSFTPYNDVAGDFYANISFINTNGSINSVNPNDLTYGHKSYYIFYDDFGENLRFGWDGSNLINYVNISQTGSAGGGVLVGNNWSIFPDHNATTFDGVNDYISFGDINNISSGFTMSAWIKTEDTDNSVNWGKAIAGKFERGDSGINCFFSVNDDTSLGKVYYQVGKGVTTDITRSNANVNDGKWHHVVVLRNYTDTTAGNRIYIDGLLDKTGANQQHDVSTNAWSFVIGADQDGSESRFNGTIDEVHVYDRALSSEEINRMYNMSYIGYRLENLQLTNATQINQINLDSANTSTGDIWRTEIWASNSLGSNFNMGNLLEVEGLIISLNNLYLNSTDAKNRTSDNLTLSFTPYTSGELESYDANITFYQNNTDTQEVTNIYNITNYNILENTPYQIFLDSANTTKNNSYLAQVQVWNESMGGILNIYNTSWLLINPTNVTPTNYTMLSESGLNKSYEDLNVSFKPDDIEAPFTWRIWFWVSDTFNSITQWFIGDIINSFIFKQGNFSAMENVTAQIETNTTEGRYFENVTTDIDNSVPSTPTLQYPVNNTKTANYTIILECNASTDADNSSQTTQYEFYINSSNLPTTIHQNSTNTTYAFVLSSPTFNGEYWWRCRANDNITASNYSTPRYFEIDRRLLLTNVTDFNHTVLEGTLQEFKINLTKNNLTVSDIDASFIYDNVSYTVTKLQESADRISFNSSLVIPSISTDPTIKYLNWNLTIKQLNNTYIYNTSFSGGQSVRKFYLDNCSTYGDVLFNFNHLDEETQIKLGNGTIEASFNIYSINTDDLVFNYSDSFLKINPLKICINESLTSSDEYYMDVIVRYEAPDYASEYYNIIDFELNNDTITQNISLYDLNISDSTDFQLTFTGSDFLPVENALVYVDRQYVLENTFKTVELPKTDSNGQTILHLVRNDVIYNIRIVKDGSILGNFENINAFCEDYTIGDCKIILNAFDSGDVVFDYDEELGIVFDAPTYNETTRVITFDFLTSDGTSKDIRMYVENRDIFGNRTLCNTSLISSGGSLQCTVPSSIDDSSLIMNIYVDNLLVIVDNVIIDSSNFGVAGYFILFIVAITFILIFSGTKTGVLIGIGLTCIFGIAIGLITGSIFGIGASFLWILIIILIGIYKLNKERTQ